MATDILFPDDVPAPSAYGHSFAPIDISESAEFEVGEIRRRKRYRSVPQVATVSWLMTLEQFQSFSEWYETILLAGTKPFDIRLAKQGEYAMTWWTAIFVGPYSAEALHNGRWRVSASLLLTGEQFDERVAPSMRGNAFIRFGPQATINATPDTHGAATIVITTQATIDAVPLELYGSASIVFDSSGTIASSGILTEDGDFILLESGGRIILE